MTAAYDNQALPQRADLNSLTRIAVQQRFDSWARGVIWRGMARLIHRCPRRLLELSATLCGLKVRGQHYAGLRTVPISQICGSEGRASDFDSCFRPYARRSRQRWQSVALAWEEGHALPPVELIAVGDSYFVRDGHHRISVAAAYGASTVEALVVVWEIDSAAPAQQEVTPCTDVASCYA